MTKLIKAYAPTDDTGKTRIVFVHGLDGHYLHTWMSNKKDNETLWPKWIGEATGCPVWLAGYAASKTRWFGDAMSLSNLGSALLDTLCSDQAFNGDEQIVLVGHSLGGLVIKTAIKSAFSLGVPRYVNLAQKIKGVVFIGTPHFGSIWASIVSCFYLARPNPQMRNLGLHDGALGILNIEFRKLVSDYGIKTKTFVETQPMRLPLVGRLLPGVTIVNPTSSEPNLSGEVGVPIEAHHLNICKPKDRSAHIHKSLLSFLEQFNTARSESLNMLRKLEIRSDSMDANLPSERGDTDTHLAFAMFGDGPDDIASICTVVCIVTDVPEQLCQQLQGLSKDIQADPMVDAKAKLLSQNASLGMLLSDSGTRDAALKRIATISFSAYLYYCDRKMFNRMSEQDRASKLLVSPLVHRLSKRNEKVVQYHCKVGDFEVYLKSAIEEVKTKYHRDITLPEQGRKKYHVLVELAQFTAQVSSKYLTNFTDSENAKVFQHLRTRIRFAENVATGACHTRDKNPLP
ncbi:hypothetical protein [Undibacterium sp. TS12]|uniref:esterase/lipase family protein n=1 Tax=Undibacterium sp. TS12 TaxID=2908202 RepID=UPI001F4CF89F|nr:hypothetical protein [Undibacterium sp. TS12]MCH8623012.1 hypothetical protein [Undibacterium sp. TS12]